MSRKLVVTRRNVPLDRVEDYHAAWRRVRDAVHEAGGRAWVFRGADRIDHFLEFIESREMDSLMVEQVVVAARDELDALFAPRDLEAWDEATGS